MPEEESKPKEEAPKKEEAAPVEKPEVKEEVKPKPKTETSKKGRKKKVEKPKYNFYETSGESISRKNKSCPRCGPGIFLAVHSGRLACGKCGYTEFENK